MMVIAQKYWYVLVAIIVLLIAFIVVLLVYIKNNSNTKSNKNAVNTNVPKSGIGKKAMATDNVHRTKFVEIGDRASGDTMLLFDAPCKLWIGDMDRPDIKFEMPLTDAGVSIGFDKSNQVCLDYDDTVSGVHCRIYPSGRKTYIENKIQTNPVIVNGQKIEESAAIYSGTEIIVGNIRLSVKFA